MNFQRLLISLILSISVLSACNTGSDNSNNGGGEPTIPASTPEPEPTTNITEEGGTIEITDTTSPIFGAKITLDSKALVEAENITLSYEDEIPAPIDSGGTGLSVVVLSKTLVIERTGEIDFITRAFVTMPYDAELVPDGLVPIVIYWDEMLETYSPIEVVDINSEEGYLTFVTAHASKFIICYVDITAFIEIGATNVSLPRVETGFTAENDGFFMKNFGSYLAPSGNCFGMAAFAAWYFKAKDELGEVNLIDKYNQGDQSIYEDDFVKQELISRAYYAADQKGHAEAIQKVIDASTEEQKVRQERENALSLIMELAVSGPQTLAIYDQTAKESPEMAYGHVVTVYSYDPATNLFWYYDPNYPKEERALSWTYSDGFEEAEDSIFDTERTIKPEYFAYASFNSAYSSDFLMQLYEDAEAGFNQSIFPPIEITNLDQINDDEKTFITSEVTDDGVVIKGQVERSERATNQDDERYLHVYVDGVQYTEDGVKPEIIVNKDSEQFEFTLDMKTLPFVDVAFLVSDNKKTWRTGLHAFDQFTISNENCTENACASLVSVSCTINRNWIPGYTSDEDVFEWRFYGKAFSTIEQTVPSASPGSGLYYGNKETIALSSCEGGNWRELFYSQVTTNEDGEQIPRFQYCAKGQFDELTSTFTSVVHTDSDDELYSLGIKLSSAPDLGLLLYRDYGEFTCGYHEF